MTDCNMHTALVVLFERLQEILRLWLNGKHRLIDNRPNMTECLSRRVWQSAALPLSLLLWSDCSQASRWAPRMDATRCNAIYPKVSASQTATQVTGSGISQAKVLRGSYQGKVVSDLNASSEGVNNRPWSVENCCHTRSQQRCDLIVYDRWRLSFH